ncbi:hypothetical protein MMC26_006604 [Xylographa opegraphella]|nr:hypothetical protein [Xylographa opegraphella]
MNHMNMNGLNVGNGATVGMPMMSNGTNGVTSRTGNDQDRELEYKTRLNTYIYDYLLKQESYDCARALLKSGLAVQIINKPSPGRRPNGTDEGSIDADSKDDIESQRPHDLPLPEIAHGTDNSFLLEWFSVFWDIFFAARKDSKKTSHQAYQYVQHTQQQNRMRQEQQQQFLRNPGMIGQNMNYQNMFRMQQVNGMPMNSNEMQRRAHQNLRNLTPQQMIARNQHQLMQQQQMERVGSDVDINGQRPRTPSSGDNAPSPSKRPRLDGPPFNGQQMMQNGRVAPQGMHPTQRMNMNMANQSNQLLVQNGIHPSYLTPHQLESFHSSNPQVQEKSIKVYAQNMMMQQQRQSMPQSGVPNQGSPMMTNGMDGGMPDYYNGNTAMRITGPGGQSGAGNHALQDYQMQLMLLEQQNKKRLLMARQEQDNLNPNGQQALPGPSGVPPGMSPQGSRSGPSPNPSEQMKRGTPKMGQVGLPGSPMPDGYMPPNRGSPGAMNFAPMPPDMLQATFKMGDGTGGMPNGSMMRPPSSHPQFANGMNPQQMDAMRAQAANGGRMPNGVNWPQGSQGQAPMMPQGSQPQPPIGTPQQRTMLPPQGPPAGAATNGRPSSPAQPAAPPTPSQTNKAAPKKGKDGAKEPRKRPTKKGSTAAATPSSEAEIPPPTPTPSTPITPMHEKSFSSQKNGNSQTGGSNAQAPTSVPAPATVPQPQPEPNFMPPFGTMDIDPSMDMTFGNIDNGEVLEQFDFDSFLDSEHPGFDLDASMTFDNVPMEFGNVES